MALRLRAGGRSGIRILASATAFVFVFKFDAWPSESRRLRCKLSGHRNRTFRHQAKGASGSLGSLPSVPLCRLSKYIIVRSSARFHTRLCSGGCGDPIRSRADPSRPQGAKVNGKVNEGLARQHSTTTQRPAKIGIIVTASDHATANEIISPHRQANQRHQSASPGALD